MARARPPAVCSRALARTPPATTNAQALDGSWRVRYSNCVPPSNGQLGPFVGLPLQVVDIDKGSYQNRLAFLNRSLPSPSLFIRHPSSVILDPFRCICEGSLKHEHTRTHTLCVGVCVGVCPELQAKLEKEQTQIRARLLDLENDLASKSKMLDNVKSQLT